MPEELLKRLAFPDLRRHRRSSEVVKAGRPVVPVQYERAAAEVQAASIDIVRLGIDARSWR